MPSLEYWSETRVYAMMRKFDTSSLVSDLSRAGAVVIPSVLLQSTIADLLDEAESFSWQPCPRRKVRQEYEYVIDFPEGSLYRTLRVALERHLTEGFLRHMPRPVTLPLTFNFARLQRYPEGSIGIDPHRDGDSCRSVIALFVLEGGGRFCLCDDKETRAHMRVLEHDAGDLILMRGSDFLGENIQPIHFVEGVEERRVTYGLRHAVCR